MNLTNLVHSSARSHPGRLAVIDFQRTLTYRDLAERISGLAAGLRDLGVRPGDRVALLIGNRTEHLESLLAIARCGATALPIDPHSRAAELSSLIERFQPAALITEESEREEVETPWRATGKPLIATGQDYERLAHSGGDYDANPASDVPCFIMLSSGTTGQPKGALVSHAAMAFRFTAQLVTFGFSPSDRYLNVMPLHTGGGRSFSLSHLYLGALVILQRRFSADEATQLVLQHQVTTTCFVPTMLHRLLNQPRQWPTMRALITSGAALSEEQRARVLADITPNLYDYYASVEAGGVAVLGPGEHAAKAGTVGRSMWGTEIRIGAAGGAAHDATGEIFYRSPGMISGYVGGEGADAFEQGWYRTGDLGRLDADGYLSLGGRVKEMIISGGVNVFPAEIEAALLEHPAVSDAAVVGLPDAEWGERVEAFIVAGPRDDLDTLPSFVRDRLAGPKRPKRFHRLDELPRNSGGKVDRAALREIAKQNPPVTPNETST